MLAGPARRIGLLGGSFNPAHQGHMHLSQVALRRLGLDEVWWLVSPQNPLKSADGLADYARRLARARSVAAADRRIRVTDIEARRGLRFTADTLRHLLDAWPARRFVWLMGADNLTGFHRWRRWREIARLVPIAVIDRPGAGHRPRTSRAARTLARWQKPEAASHRLPAARPPAWVLLSGALHPASSTAIRDAGGWP